MHDTENDLGSTVWLARLNTGGDPVPEELCKWCDVNELKGKQLQDYEYKIRHKDES